MQNPSAKLRQPKPSKRCASLINKRYCYGLNRLLDSGSQRDYLAGQSIAIAYLGCGSEAKGRTFPTGIIAIVDNDLEAEASIKLNVGVKPRRELFSFSFWNNRTDT